MSSHASFPGTPMPEGGPGSWHGYDDVRRAVNAALQGKSVLAVFAFERDARYARKLAEGFTGQRFTNIKWISASVGSHEVHGVRFDVVVFENRAIVRVSDHLWEAIEQSRRPR